jgi:hypothetical protein
VRLLVGDVDIVIGKFQRGSGPVAIIRALGRKREVTSWEMTREWRGADRDS